jgi:hypothetical protein
MIKRSKFRKYILKRVPEGTYNAHLPSKISICMVRIARTTNTSLYTLVSNFYA